MNEANQTMAGQIVTFGLHLDGQRSFTPHERLGEIEVGPLGMLNILETQLGLLGVTPSQSERIVQYRDRLVLANEASRFYHETFAVDALGTAATLLAWRDLWHLHGWTGEAPPKAGARLVDLAKVEEFAASVVAPSVGERLAQVLEQLKRRSPGLAEVRLVDSLDAFPGRWRSVLARLPIREIALTGTSGQGFLGQLQARLRNAQSGQAASKLSWVQDGSVRVVQGETKFIAASWLATQLDDETPALIISGGEGARLDATLVSSGLPRQGLKEASAFRPSLQVLPLALELLWEPLNFYGLIQFLTHPVCPIPSFARGHLAAKVADAPGVGGEAWGTVLESIAAHYEGQEATKVLKTISFWVEHPRYHPKEGAPLATVLERVERLTEFFRLRLGDANPARSLSFHAGYAQCHGCARALKSLLDQGIETIEARQLQILVAQATAQGTENPLWVAEVGAKQVVTNPGAAVQPIDHVIWWQFAMPELPSNYPWSTSEIRTLGEVGVALPSTDSLLSRAASDWLRPIFAARKQLTLVLPPKGEEVHPIWQMIEAVVESPPIISLEDFLKGSSALTLPVRHKPLPPARRWWQLPADVKVALRKKESFSSLELMVFNPYHWLLRYPAALRASRIISLNDDFRILGTLAHDLVDRLYRQSDALKMNDAQFLAWFSPAFERLVREEGASLLMPGKGVDLEGFRNRLLRSVITLRSQVAKAGVRRIESELALNGSFRGGELSGFADLVMDLKDGGRAVIDMKWSGSKKYPEKLKQNSHLQLAIYAELLHQASGSWPVVAYYILDRARFFTPNEYAFPDAEVVVSDAGENTAQLWQRFLESWAWRKRQIESGLFEVAIESIDATDASDPPDNGLVPEYLNESYNEFRALAGWGS